MNWKQLQDQVVDGEFQLVEHLGGTAESATFIATAPGNVKAAVKLVVARRNQELPSRWKVSESLSHPHLLRVFRSGTAQIGGADLLFLVMEYAEENLSQVLPQRALTPDEVREMLPPVLDALQYLHGEQLVHGNLRPGNIMAAGDQLKLSSDSVTRFGHPLLASSPYTAPEASNGADAPSDLWSLGVTLTEVLTQRRPTWDPGSTLAQLPDNMPEQFRVMVQRCLIPDPALRGTIADIRERLKPPATPPTPVPQPKPTANKRPPYRFAIPVGIATVAIGVFISISHKADTPAPPASPNAESTTSSQTPPPFQSPPPAVLTEATDPKPAHESKKAEPDKPQKVEVLMSAKTATNAPPPPPKPQTVASSKSVVSGTDIVVQRVLPDIPQKAMRTINGKFRVMVRVRVNQDGDVVGSEFASRGPSKYFADLTLQAAKQWKFSRAETSERAWNLEFEFRRSGITASPTRIDR